MKKVQQSISLPLMCQIYYILITSKLVCRLLQYGKMGGKLIFDDNRMTQNVHFTITVSGTKSFFSNIHVMTYIFLQKMNESFCNICGQSVSTCHLCQCHKLRFSKDFMKNDDCNFPNGNEPAILYLICIYSKHTEIINWFRLQLI